MANNDKQVINFAKEVKKRTGVELDEEKIARGTPARVPVDVEHDHIVRLAMSLLSVIRNEGNSVVIVAALQLVGNTMSEELIRAVGSKQAAKIAAAATVLSSQYKPEFPNETA
jgi:hypothetical protein